MTSVRQSPPPSIRLFPRHDRCFAMVVSHVAALLVPIGGEAGAIEAVLRTVYPEARVRVRHGIAGMTGELPVWYAFRDGRVAHEDRRDGVARVTTGRIDVPRVAPARRPCEGTDTRTTRRRPVAIAAGGA